MRKYKFLFVLFYFTLMVLIIKPDTAASEAAGHVTILFTHDLHDNFLPFRAEREGFVSEWGGYGRLMTAIQAEKRINSEALLLDAGDFSMGTPFQTVFMSDAPGLRLLGKMGYDVVTFGNHEYDYRAQGLAHSLNSALNSGERLPLIVQSNVIFPEDESGKLTTSLSSLKQAYSDYGVKDYVVIIRNGIRIGIFGLMGEDAASKAPMSEVEFTDVIENAQRVVTILKDKEKADLIICLSHSGTSFDSSKSEDEILATKVPDINVIISGHTHTKLSEPIVVGKTIIGSTEDSGKYLGVLKVSQNVESGWVLDSYRLQPISDTLAAEPEIVRSIEQFKQSVNEKYFSLFHLHFDQVLADSPFHFDSLDAMNEKHDESALGNLITDAYLYAVKKAEGHAYVPIDAAVVPIGTIRSSFYKGSITAADAFSVSSLGIGPDNIPGYPLISVYLTGKELKTVCEVDASVSPLMGDAQLYLSGLHFTFNPNRLIFNKVTHVFLQKPDGQLEEIDDEKLYRVVAGLYSAQMLGVVGEKSFGLLSIVPKTQDGTPVTDFEAQIIRDTASGSKAELKEWMALAAYLQSFEKVNGVSQVPDYYNEKQGRKMVDDNHHILALISSPNSIALTVYAIVIILAALIAFVVYKLVTRNKRLKRNRFNPQQPI